ncbi:hypothetical protein [Paenibacillus sp. ATY16]|uniref:hypothetical protein n=1 Tax=Paenibacillus sp. ATY16 TaxID=1759312 RepID=UPI000E2F6969|nr:hypothetical protein [Paenibacillus sp. ATY16]MCK9859274.1 hypothetical protein [Paenibacillus sp. ATY16]
MKKFGIIFFLAIVLLISGCQKNSSKDELAEAQKNVDQIASSFKIPKIDGYEISSVQHVLPPKDEQGKFIGDNQKVVIAYTKNKGKLEKLSDDEKGNNERKILYGPYQGDTSILITHSNLPEELDNGMITIGTELVERAKVGKHTLLIYNTTKGSITMDFNNFDDDTLLTIAEPIINENK